MKIRSGFVSNSSSSSFIIWSKDEWKSAEDLQDWLDPCGTFTMDELKYNKKTRESVRLLKSLKNRGQINNGQYEHIIDVMKDADYNLGSPLDPYIPAKTVAKRIWNKSNGIKPLKYSPATSPEDYDYPKDKKYRQIYEITDWRQQLFNKQSYLYNVIKDNVHSEFYHDEINIERNHSDRKGYMWNNCTNLDLSCFMYSSRDPECGAIKETIDKLTEQLTDYAVNDILETVPEDAHVYYIEWCTDDGESDEIDSLGRQGIITRNAWIVLRDEHS